MRLYVNIDHVATVREARRTDEPDPVHAAFAAELGGADGITVHLREDRRHIHDRDVRLLAETVRTGVNLELAPADDVVAIACELKPMQATLVPERREEVTTEGGLNLESVESRRTVGGAVERLRDAGIRVSLFIDPVDEALRLSSEMGVEAIELHTGEYANAKGDLERAHELGRLRAAAEEAVGLGLAVHAGHGLTYANVAPVAALPMIEELNIGHSIVARALSVGMTAAVQEMRRLVTEAPSRVSEPGQWIPPIGY
jgi:pyridoxine 5-phosphate synthase